MTVLENAYLEPVWRCKRDDLCGATTIDPYETTAHFG